MTRIILQKYYRRDLKDSFYIYQLIYIYKLRDSAVQNVVLSIIDVLDHFARYHIPHVESGKA